MTIYLVTIGIAEYPASVPSLKGCVNDAVAVNNFFREYAKANGYALNTYVNSDQHWTRAAIEASFSHFSAAGERDVCVFYFSGHGSEVFAPEEFWDVEINRKCETLVCYDSRLSGGRDLLDKEIAYLLSEFTTNAGHTLAIFDSCHSGSVSRGTVNGTPRMAEGSWQNIRFTDLAGHQEYRPPVGKHRHPKIGKHIALSACRSRQLAYETDFAGVRQGVFTHFLLECLRQVDLSETSYYEIMSRVRTRVAGYFNEQEVQLRPRGGAKATDVFFGGLATQDVKYILDYDPEQESWFIGQGEVQGVRLNSVCTVWDGLQIREVTFQNVTPARAYVTTAPWMDSVRGPYRVEALHLLRQPTLFYADADLPAMDMNSLRRYLDQNRWLNVALTGNLAMAKYRITRYGRGYTATLTEDERPIFKSVDYLVGWEEKFAEKLRKVARYEYVYDCGPVKKSLRLPDIMDVVFEWVFIDDDWQVIEEDTLAIPKDGSGVFSYFQEDGWDDLRMPRLRLKIKLKQQGPDRLYVGALFLDEEFGIHSGFMPVKEIKKGEEYYKAFTTRPDGSQDLFIPLNLDKELQVGWGITEVINHFKIFASEQDFELFHFDQEGLESESAPNARGGEQERDLNSPLTRGAGNDSEARQRSDGLPRWGVWNIPFTIHRPLDAADGQDEGGATKFKLSTSDEINFSYSSLELDSTSSKSMSQKRTTVGNLSPLPNIPDTETVHLGWRSLREARTVATIPKQDVLRLVNPVNWEAVSDLHPLSIEFRDTGVEANERLLVLGYDTELATFYPVGYADENGKVIVEQIPPPVADGYTRAPKSTATLFFRKIKARQKRVIEKGELCKVSILNTGGTKYLELDTAAIKAFISYEQIRKGRPLNIALFIHGIIGNTTAMPNILQQAKDGTGRPLSERYDLLLTFDYENLSTRIGDSATDLRDRIYEIGLTDGHDHQLDIFAHSMGGLVSRSMIETLEKHGLVRRLFQFGTPNEGSPLIYGQQLGVILLSRLFSGLSALTPFAKPLLGANWALNAASVTAKEMMPNSEFLLRLAKGQRGTVPYYLISGDVKRSKQYNEKLESFYQRLLSRFQKEKIITTTFFQGESNDIAVSLSSQQALSREADFQITVPCDHMSYFTSEAGVKGLEAAFRVIDGEEKSLD